MEAASIVNGVPIERGLNLNVNVLDGPELIERAVVDWRYASLNYFETMRIPIVSGRGFTDGDRAGASPVAVVSEEFARRFLNRCCSLASAQTTHGPPGWTRRARTFPSSAQARSLSYEVPSS